MAAVLEARPGLVPGEPMILRLWFVFAAVVLVIALWRMVVVVVGG
jgi:hypothetical protein